MERGRGERRIERKTYMHPNSATEAYEYLQGRNAFEIGSRSAETFTTHIDIYDTHTFIRVMMYVCHDVFTCYMINSCHGRVATRLKPAAAVMRYV